MKKYFITSVLLIAIKIVAAQQPVIQDARAALPVQNPPCKSLHTGTFKITTEETGTTFITRNDTLQTEENTFLGYKIIFDITWIDDCTYDLRPKKLIKGDPWILGDGKNVLRTRIKNITSKSYTAETSSNFDDGVINFEVEIIN